ncbi:MAG: hypothetical protein ACOYO1_09605 [Bacteroidales bacterium]
MKKYLILYLLLCITISIKAQKDTIFTNNEKIICNVKEVTPDAIKFTYPDEDVMNSVFKNTVQKIVYKSGRNQVFAEATSFKKLNSAEDYENVTITQVESEIKGLFKTGEVHSKAKGTTTLSSMEKVKGRAYKKLKIIAAMKGANIIYLTQQNTEGNQAGSQFQSGKSTETNLAGVAYSNVLPNFDEFNKIFGSKKEYTSFQEINLGGSDADMYIKKDNSNVSIQKIYNESGLIMIDAVIEGVKTNKFRVNYFDKETFTLLFENKDTIYNLKIK